jgi:hypothetical protein
MSPEAIILIIGALSLGVVNIITALKVRSIEHNVNSAATKQVEKVDQLTKQVADLTKLLSDEKLIAERLAQYAGPARRTRK